MHAEFFHASLTLLPGVGVPELLNSAPNLFGGATLACRLKNVIRDKLVPHRQTAQSLGGTGASRPVLVKTFEVIK